MKKKLTESYKTVVVIMLGLLVVYVVWHYEVLLVAALIIGLLAFVSETMALTIHKLWMGLAQVLGMIFPPVILGAVYFLLLTPIALLSKLFSKNDPLMLKNNKQSTFISCTRVFDKGSFEKLW